MIDIHNHIIFEVDDGACSLDESIKMIELAYSQGYKEIIATSHYIIGKYNVLHSIHSDKLEGIRKRLSEKNIDVIVHLGREVLYHFDTAKNYELMKSLTLANSRYLLIEFFFHEIPQGFEEYIYELKIRGIIPILAHCERYIHSDKDFDKIVSFYQEGALIQVNINSFIGIFGSHSAKYAEKLLNSNMVQFLASDAHRSSGIRSYEVKEGLDKIKLLIGDSKVRELTVENPKKIILNEEIEVDFTKINGAVQESHKKRKFFGLF